MRTSAAPMIKSRGCITSACVALRTYIETPSDFIHCVGFQADALCLKESAIAHG